MGLAKQQIKEFKHGLGKLYGEMGYRFTFLDGKTLVTESCASYGHYWKSPTDKYHWWYIRGIPQAVTFAKHLAKERGWKLILVEQLDLTRKVSQKKTKTRRKLVGDISIFAGTPLEAILG